MLKINSIDVYTSKKILTLNKTIKLIQNTKSKGKTVGLCHGGFDLLHPGHVKHLESAKKLCSVLIVSISSDEFVSSRKGDGRPIFMDKLRAYMVANLKIVDYVVITNFKLGTEVILFLKPTFYIKGPDFIKKTTPGIIAERKAIKKVGGSMVYTKDPKLSTTEIIRHIKNKVNNKKILVIIDRDGTIIKNNDFFGKNKNWKKEIEFNHEVVSFLSYLQTKYNTTKIVVTNQAGVARRFFDCQIVEEINNHINSKLLSKGIKINNWQYCPFIDTIYASKHPEFNLDPKYIKERTKRKPSSNMVIDGLNKIKKKLKDFDGIVIIGDRKEDEGLAKNLKSNFIDVKNKKCTDLIEIFEGH